MPRELETTYAVGTGAVRLTVVIGDAQIGGSAVFLGNERIGVGEVDHLLVGMGPSLVGKTLEIKTVVSDVNNMTNNTIVTYLLEGGVQTQEFSLPDQVDHDGDSIIYRAVFRLI